MTKFNYEVETRTGIEDAEFDTEQDYCQRSLEQAVALSTVSRDSWTNGDGSGDSHRMYDNSMALLSAAAKAGIKIPEFDSLDEDTKNWVRNYQ